MDNVLNEALVMDGGVGQTEEGGNLCWPSNDEAPAKSTPASPFSDWASTLQSLCLLSLSWSLIPTSSTLLCSDAPTVLPHATYHHSHHHHDITLNFARNTHCYSPLRLPQLSSRFIFSKNTKCLLPRRGSARPPSQSVMLSTKTKSKRLPTVRLARN